MKNIYDTIIVGSGPAGLTAAIYNVRASLKTLVIAGNQPGGQLTITTYVDNFPGFPSGVGGVKLMMDMQAQVTNLGAEVKYGVVEKVVKKDDLVEITLDSGDKLLARAMIVATGAQSKWLGIPQEKELIGRGVSGCATCDGMFFKDKPVAVVGGGNVACEEAVFLSRFTPQVYLIHRRDKLRACATEQKKVLTNPKIKVLWNTEIKELVAPKMLKEIKVFNNQTQKLNDLAINGLFVAIGREPSTDFIKELIDLKESGHIKTGLNLNYPTMTSLPGIFAAGDCVDEIYRQAIVAAGDGCRAALDIQKWLEDQEMEKI